MILKKHTNELLKVLLEETQDVNKFHLVRLDTSVGEMVKIKYEDGSMYFCLIPASEENFDLFKVYFTVFAPNLPDSGVYGNLSINDVKHYLKTWLNADLKNYIENEDDIDYWEIIKENPLTIENIDFTKDEPFKIEEREQLKLGLEEIKLLLSSNFGLTTSEIELTHKKIDYLMEATNRLNKTDWKGIAISTIVTIAYDLSFDDHKRNMLFGLFSKLWAIVQHLPSSVI